MAGVISLLAALTVSLIVNRVAAMALMFTGLSREAARFQARSAFSGVGFCTSEAESIMHHPVRRRIIMLLMLLGNIGIATVIATVMISISSTVGQSFSRQLLIAAVLGIGCLAIWKLSSSRWVERRMNKVIAWTIQRFTDLDIRDYVALLSLSHGYAVSEMIIEPRHWLQDKSLCDVRLADEGILILGIRTQKKDYIGIPRAHDVIQAGDTLIVYGKLSNIRDLDQRRAGANGDREHQAAVARQLRREAIAPAEPAVEAAAAPHSDN